MPELPEVERARALLERAALGRPISAVDDCDEWVCRPHRPGEIAEAPSTPNAPTGRASTALLDRWR
jgi:formamidopyrimidine-DNA glycosylase